MADIVSGKEVAEALKQKLVDEVDELKSNGIIPGLAIVLVGDRPDSLSYIKGAQKRCSEIGIDCRLVQLPADTSEEEFVSRIRQLNQDRSVHGILVMRPLPATISEDRVKYEISPLKDVDCFNPVNMAKVMSGEEGGFAPCTPSAVMEILDYYGIELTGKRVVIVGRSMVVGRPLSMMMLKRHATVTICHTRTVDLAKETSRAEILVAAAGKARMIKKDMVGSGAVVIDVGINFDENGKMCGDVDFEAVKELAGKITPVPGGVGSVTSTVLAKHVIRACRMLIDQEG
ncbi:bifunctional 5,10-methylenetetrahydrofolate dehydrogenase/5,10-methenyltetrahydrofolate cyclohydrolase [Thermosediminibacter litoriperuensis]|uniref:Bifunctional protein FolD n=1 Tax=Thermosediminibacter litoriperuensis TaxID=291989 RepID=A0A5S5AXM1_9FIRM|nr:tetrahydrofolate dehydrogenase/cyclohydrolase catalytic domain-containing protein [Thermosediminibacter litoriperuensis]TYP56649.1 methylenetetrahydrofolate dehydrogenase (NADP+)/methenyltetrahydrofolate cyclohydrolase [Thermosediminibacter litoriperuensis]